PALSMILPYTTLFRSAPLVDDAGFLRRASLQITGRVPTGDEVREFIAASSPNKREELVDRLLDSGAYADHFAQKWSDILRNKRRDRKSTRLNSSHQII